MIDVAKLSKEEREFVTGIINRLDGGDVKNVGAELLAEFVSASDTGGYFKRLSPGRRSLPGRPCRGV